MAVACSDRTLPGVSVEALNLLDPPSLPRRRLADGHGRRRWLRESSYYVLVGLVTSLLLIPAMDLLHVHLAVPFDYSGDALSGGTHIKNVIEHGWIDFYPALGAPFGRHGNDFPGADNLHLIIAGLLGIFQHRWAVVLNAYFLLTFPLAAMTGAWYFRVVGVRRLMAGVLGVLYAFAPYHFLRGETHLFLSAYYVVPLAGVILQRAILGEILWPRRPRRVGIVNRRTAGTVLSLALLGTASSYYSIFTLMLLTVGGVATLLHGWRWRSLLGIVAAQVILMIVMVVNMLPNMVYQLRHGANLAALQRSPNLTETHALKLSQLLLPVPYHRIHALANLRLGYDRTFPLPSESPVLGLVAALGFVFLLGLTLLRVAGRTDDPPPHVVALRALSTLATAGFLIGTVGGLSTLFALFVTDTLRGWDRIVIFLALFSLAAVGLLLDRTVVRLRPTLRRPVALLLAVAIGSIGLLDQVPPVYPSGRAAVLTAWDSDETFAQRVQHVLPRGAMVLQLPYVPFPEDRVNGTTDSDPLRMYLHSDMLKWSNGGIKGRPTADWEDQVQQLSPDRIAAVTAAIGFSAAVVDTYGYVDAGTAMEEGLRRAVGPAAFTSPDSRFVYFGFGEELARLRGRHTPTELDVLREHALFHPAAYVVSLLSSHPSVALDNPLSRPQSVEVTLDLMSKDRPKVVEVTWPDKLVDRVSLVDEQRVVTRELSLPPGRSWVRLSTVEASDHSFGLPIEFVRYHLTPTLNDSVLQHFRP
jgi:hypothetical protein